MLTRLLHLLLICFVALNGATAGSAHAHPSQDELAATPTAAVDEVDGLHTCCPPAAEPAASDGNASNQECRCGCAMAVALVPQFHFSTIPFIAIAHAPPANLASALERADNPFRPPAI